MCSMEKIASCQITFTPIGSNNYIEDINKVLEIIKSFSIEYDVSILSTVVRGEKNRILDMISTIYNTMDDICSFTMDVKISNICGCRC
jgi:uncharacterized protein YqgV (UPF0045/DUF77 family)